MILGIGTDLLDVARMAKELEKKGADFRDTVFTPAEIEYCEAKRYPARHFAARFAAVPADRAGYRYAPGKWTAAQIMLHLAQDEISWGARVRLALTTENYVVQPFDGPQWVALETPVDPETALCAYSALRELDLPLFKRIPAHQRARPFQHPEFGEISVDWILHTLAGHDRHHLEQLQTIAGL